MPETIGAVAYLNRNEKNKNIDFGLNICNCGGRGNFSYKVHGIKTILLMT